jgi:hypothetical protein
MHICDWEAIDRIPGYMSRIECEWLADCASRAVSWTELGAYCGRSMLCVGLHLPKGASLRVVDCYLGTIARAGQTLFTTFIELQQKRPDLEIVLAYTDSAKAATVLPDCDVVFVDAGHTYQNVVADIKAWRPKCRQLCGHDLNEKEWPQVARAVRELVPRFVTPTGSIWAAEG